MGQLAKNALITLLIVSAVSGCHKNSVLPNKPPEDPLLTSKKPVSGRTYVPGGDTQASLQQPTPPPPMPVTSSFSTTSLPQEPPGPDAGGR